MDDFLNAMDPNRNGLADAFDPTKMELPMHLTPTKMEWLLISVKKVLINKTQY